MFNRAYNYVSNSFSGAVETASVVTSNFTSFLGALAIPFLKGGSDDSSYCCSKDCYTYS